MERVLAWVVASRRELVASGIGEFKWLAIGALQGIRKRVEREGSSEDHCGDDIRGGDESVSGGVGIVTSGEVSVVGGDD